jgi:hypothetical protein
MSRQWWEGGTSDQAKRVLSFAIAAAVVALLVVMIGNWLMDDAAGIAPTAHLAH